MLTPILIVVLVGLVCAVILTIASKVFYVPVDETFAELREALPGANCGGCGYAGCDDYALALTEDRSVPCTKCPVGGASVADELAKILGVTAAAQEKEVAVVMCNGNNQAAKKLLEYRGLKTCVAAKQFFGGVNKCPYGCIGFGDCEAVCEYEAIKVINGIAKVDTNNCVACGMCVKACPNALIRISPDKNKNIVKCHSTAKGGDVRKACSVGCIACKKCEKVCKFDSVHVVDNLAFIEPEKCKNCGMCQKECPTGAIINIRLIAKQAKDKAKAEAKAKEEKANQTQGADIKADVKDAPKKEQGTKAADSNKEKVAKSTAKAEEKVSKKEESKVKSEESKAKDEVKKVSESVKNAEKDVKDFAKNMVTNDDKPIDLDPKKEVGPVFKEDLEKAAKETGEKLKEAGEKIEEVLEKPIEGVKHFAEKGEKIAEVQDEQKEKESK